MMLFENQVKRPEDYLAGITTIITLKNLSILFLDGIFSALIDQIHPRCLSWKNHNS